MSEPENKDLSWAAYALDGRDNPVHFFRTERFARSFAPGAFVVDVGCGDGWLLNEVRARGCRVLGTEVYDALVEATRARGCDAVRAPAEALPVETASADGVIFAGVLPFTDEDRAFSEIVRVLRPGARLEAYYLGVGFALRDLLLAPTLRKRYFGARALVNTVLKELFGVKLPGRFGDTVYVSHRRLGRFYARHGLTLRMHTPSPTFLGLPVFIYHTADRGAAREEGRPLPA